jgi:hypothetical protein
MIECPHCGNQLPVGAAFCNQCWRPVDDPPGPVARTDEPPVAEHPIAEAAPEAPTFTPAPGGPPPPEADDVTSAYPPVPPPQPPSPWASGAPAAPGWGQDPQWSQPSSPAPDPYGYAAPAPGGSYPPAGQQPPGPPPQPGYGQPAGYGPPPGGYAPPGGYGPSGGYGPPGGYGPSGYPPPAYGYPPYYGYQTPAGPGTNGKAIAALVSALGGLVLSCGLLSPIGIVLGHISLSQIRRTGQEGRGMAIAGLVIGYLCLAGIIVSVIAIVASSP